MKPLGASRAVIMLDATYVPPAAGGAAGDFAASDAQANVNAITLLIVIVSSAVLAGTLGALVVYHLRARAAASAASAPPHVKERRLQQIYARSCTRKGVRVSLGVGRLSKSVHRKLHQLRFQIVFVNVTMDMKVPVRIAIHVPHA